MPEALSVVGEENPMADAASRSLLVSDADLVAKFNQNYPLSQNRSWKLVTLPPEAISKVVSTLRGNKLTMAQWTSPVGRSTGNIGSASPSRGACPPISSSARRSNRLGCSARLLSGSGRETTGAAFESLRNQWNALSVPLARPSNWLDDQAPRKSMAAASESFSSAASSNRTGGRIRRRDRSSQSPSP